MSVRWTPALRLGALHLGAGAVVNVLVAWGLGAWLPYSDMRGGSVSLDHPEVGGILRVDISWVSRPGMVRREVTWQQLHSMMFSSLGWGVTTSVHEREEEWLARNDWGRLHAGITTEDTGYEDARGWPWLALWCGIDRGGAWRVEGGLLLTPKAARIDGVRTLPLRPLWGGFVLNALVYGCVTASLHAAGVGWVRHRRRRAGRCARCGYDVAGLERCPECGPE